MIKVQKFLLYGQDDPGVEESIQSNLNLRSWGSLSETEKITAFQELINNGWFSEYSHEVLHTIVYLNHNYLRRTPGKHLHSIQPKSSYRGFSNESERIKAARMDFQHIFIHEKSDALVFRMLTKLAERYINHTEYRWATEAKDEKERNKHITNAFQKFDYLANCLNHIFEQFSVNVLLTRNGLLPRQDEKITENIYIPTLKILANPKWRNVSDDLAKMFEDYQNGSYPETITKAHRAVQRFLQILVGEEGKSGKGEMGKLFAKAKQAGVIPANHFTEPLISVLGSFIPSERATKSTAKPTLKTTTPSDALLMMNVVMVFLQYCLQEIR